MTSCSVYRPSPDIVHRKSVRAEAAGFRGIRPRILSSLLTTTILCSLHSSLSEDLAYYHSIPSAFLGVSGVCVVKFMFCFCGPCSLLNLNISIER